MRLSKLTNDEIAAYVLSYRDFGRMRGANEHFRTRQDNIADALDELIGRRAAEQSETRKTERSFAYEFCVSLIDADVANVADEDGDVNYEWYDDTEIDQDSGEPSAVQAIAYLEARGLIERDPEHNHHFSIRDESEETC